MTGREADILDVIEAAYAVDRGRDAWLQAIAEAARPVLDCGLGTVAYTTDLRQPGRPVSSRPYTASDVFGQEHGEFFLSDDVVDPELREMMHFSSPVVATGSELAGDRWNDTVAVAAPHGLMDFLGINHLDPSGFCLTLGAPLSELRQATSEERECWSRIACHLGAGLRLRDELEREAQ
nr:hypothetical protein [Polyangiaceae bacterium]